MDLVGMADAPLPFPPDPRLVTHSNARKKISYSNASKKKGVDAKVLTAV